MKNGFMFLAIVGLVILLAACGTTTGASVKTIEGSGNVVTSERNTGSFSRIQIDLRADLVLIQGDSEHLTVEADENLMEYIKTEVENGTLVVSTPDNINLAPSRTIQLALGFHTLAAIDINGSSNIAADDLDLDRLVISFAGSGSARFTGRIDEQTINIQGQATINNYDLSSQRVSVDISGDGTIEVNAADTLDITVTGRGEIGYTGNPTITRNVSGTANITRRQE